MGRTITGAILAVIGSAVLTGLVWMTNASTPAAERLMFKLGLGLTGLIAALGQALVLYGVWLLWSAAAGRGAGRRSR
ncbi:hypothetical protein [Phenylobacterium sp. J367]|uniref:hypothetical protein n=1 Tax=Phenylobacterium sp. J367 TaxID=2898435 RepID=UPI002151E8C0|nr:hypothetical protein [Phenylobacterium sp. J367]MCR5877837.1 hypothetical protein [Phenylobacterium sp. J367]